MPQGSVIEPISFILYIIDICDLNIGGLVVTYTDDTYLLFSDKCWGMVQNKLL